MLSAWCNSGWAATPQAPRRLSPNRRRLRSRPFRPCHLNQKQFRMCRRLLRSSRNPRKLAFPGPPRSALCGVHLQSQMLLDPALYRGQRAFCGGLTAYVGIAVIRIPAVAMLPPIQFLVRSIQIDVRQQRRQRPTLQRSLLDSLHQSVYHGSPPQVFPDQAQHPLVPDTFPIRPISMS